MSHFFISLTDLAALLRCAARHRFLRQQQRRLNRARDRGQKTVQVSLAEYERLLKLDSTDACLETFRAVKPLRESEPAITNRQRRIIEAALERGANATDLMTELQDIDARSWDEQGRELGPEDVAAAERINRGRVTCDNLKPRPLGLLEGIGWNERADERRRVGLEVNDHVRSTAEILGTHGEAPRG